MTKTTLTHALVFGLAIAATPALAGNLGFEAVAPEGLDAKATQMVKALQSGLPSQMAAFEAQGFKHYGAIAVPTGVALSPEMLSSVANLDSREAASTGVLEACATQTGAQCTVIGYLIPLDG